MNAHCERFNRTIQESFIDYHEDLLFTNLDAFNQELADWLVFYNTERPHQALAMLSPVQSLITNQPECDMLCTYMHDARMLSPSDGVSGGGLASDAGQYACKSASWRGRCDPTITGRP